MYFRVLMTLIVVAIIIFSGCEKSEETYLVKVGSQKITADELELVFPLNLKSAEGGELTTLDVRHYIEQKFVDNLLYQAAAFDANIDKSSDFISEFEISKKNYITGMGGPLYQKIIQEKLTVSEEDIKKLYDRMNKEVRAGQIMVQTKQLADSLYQVLLKKNNFSELAKAYSIDRSTASKGGIMERYIIPADLAPILDSTIFALNINEISAPVKTTAGYHILKVFDIRSKERKEYDVIRRDLKARLELYQRKYMIENYILSLHNEFQINIIESEIPKVVANINPQAMYEDVKTDKLSDDLLKTVVLKYNGGEWTIQYLYDKFNQLPNARRIPLNNKDNVIEFIKMNIVQDLMYMDAIRKGIDQEEEVMKNIEGGKLSILRKHYLQKMIHDKAVVLDKEINRYYKNNKDKYGNTKLEDIKTTISDFVRKEKEENLKKELMKNLKDKYEIEFSEKGLEGFVERIKIKIKNLPRKSLKQSIKEKVLKGKEPLNKK